MSLAYNKRRICCCGTQPHITIDDVYSLALSPQYQLRNLPHTFDSEIQGRSIYDIREFFSESHIPFRYRECVSGSTICCCSCTCDCSRRCVQDVLNRAFLLCGSIMYGHTEEEREKRFREAHIGAQMMYKELTSESPRYPTIVAMVHNIINPKYNKGLKEYMAQQGEGSNNPYLLDYAPRIVYAPRANGHGVVTEQPVVNPETGEVLLLNWPQSGLCPFCLPVGLSNRRLLKKGPKKKKSP